MTGLAAIAASSLPFSVSPVVAGLIFFGPHSTWADLAIILILFFVADSILRRAFVQTVGRITLILAMLAAVILFLHFWKWIILAALLVMGISLMVQRLRELTG